MNKAKEKSIEGAPETDITMHTYSCQTQWFYRAASFAVNAEWLEPEFHLGGHRTICTLVSYDLLETAAIS